MPDFKKLSLIERASQMKGNLRRSIRIAHRTQGAESTMPTSTYSGEKLILLIDELSKSLVEQNTKLEETEKWKAHMRGQARNAIDRMEEFVQKTSAELDDLKRESDDAIAAARLMYGRVEAALEFDSAIPQQAADHLRLALRIYASSQRSEMTNQLRDGASSKARRHTPNGTIVMVGAEDEVPARSDP